MSRIRIINLPKTVDEQQLKDHLIPYLPHGARDITDISVIRNKSNGAVRMAFVGFNSASLGNKVVKEADGTYFGAMPMRVSTALGLKESRDLKEQEEKEHVDHVEKRRLEKNPNAAAVAADSSELPKRRGRGGAGEDGDEEQQRMDDDDLVNERMLEKAQAGGPSWGAELLLPPEQAQQEDKKSKNKKGQVGDDDDDEGDHQQQQQQALDLTSDEAFLRSITVPSSNKQQQQHDDDDGEVHFNFNKSSTTETSTRVRVTNLPYVATAKDLKNFFSSRLHTAALKSGADSAVDHTVVDAHVPVTKDTQQSKGAGYVRFETHDGAVNAAAELDGAVFMGRVVRVIVAEEDPYALKKQQTLAAAAAAELEAAANGTSDGSSSFREMRDAKRKKADNLGLSWNTTYVGNSQAVALTAKKLGVESSDIVGSGTQGAAVRAAVAEAHVTAEARKVLGSEGINFELLSGDRALHCNRSDTTILVKHIAAGMSVQELSSLFSKCGTLDAVAAPPDLSLALIRFVDAEKAKVAFQRLAYKKIKGTPLFLEWAPIGSFNDGEGGEEAVDDDDPLKVFSRAQNNNNNAAAAESAAPRSVFTVYITNLPFGVAEPAFRDFIADSVPKIAAHPELITKVSLIGNKGRAYVTVADTATESALISKLDGKSFQGRTLSAVMSKSDVSAAGAAPASVTAGAAASGGAATTTSGGKDENDHVGASASSKQQNPNQCPAGRDPLKLIVKNLPFEATEADLRQLFAAFSEVKSVRVPRRVQRFNAHHTNNHRGFGFVEFLTADEAARAKAALGSTHLYGRHLVLDYAEKAGLDFAA